MDAQMAASQREPPHAQQFGLGASRRTPSDGRGSGVSPEEHSQSQAWHAANVLDVADLSVESVMNELRERAAESDERDGGDESGEDLYWRTTRFHDAFNGLLNESVTACDLYAITNELTDMWELDFDGRAKAAALMRDATDELLAVRGEEELDAYVTRWKERLSVS